MRSFIPALILSMLAPLAASAEDIQSTSSEPVIAVQVTTPATQRLADVKKIFIAQLGTGEGAEMIRQKLNFRLSKSGSLTIVESADAADAVLLGGAEVNHHHYLVVNNGFVSSGTKYHAEGVLRLVDKKQNILWTDEISSRKYFPPHSSKGASSNVADKIVRRLTEAIEADKSQIASLVSTGL